MTASTARSDRFIWCPAYCAAMLGSRGIRTRGTPVFATASSPGAVTLGVLLRTGASRRVVLATAADEREQHVRQTKKALKRAIAKPSANRVVPKDAMAGYSGTPLPKKLGIKPGFTVALVDAPEDFVTNTLGDALPADVSFTDGKSGARDLTVWFIRCA